MTQLADYLTANNIRQADFAKRIGVDQATVSRLARKLMTPRLDLAATIERETGGAVPIAFWVCSPEAAE